MKWVSPKQESQPRPELNDTRVVIKFAILPHEAADGFTYWLQLVRVEQTYIEHAIGEDTNIADVWESETIYGRRWKDTRWLGSRSQAHSF